MNHNHTHQPAPDLFGAFSYPEENVSADVVPVPGATGDWLGWCEQCQEGFRNNSISRAQRWVDKHNEAAHESASLVKGQTR